MGLVGLVTAWLKRDEFSDVTVVRPVNQIIKTDRIGIWSNIFLSQATKDQLNAICICDADRMHVNAAEFPPKKVIENLRVKFIFSADSRWKLVLPTIKSWGPFSKSKISLKRISQEGLLLQQADLLCFSQRLRGSSLAQNTSSFSIWRGVWRAFRCSLSKRRSTYHTDLSLVQGQDDKKSRPKPFACWNYSFTPSVSHEETI